MVNVTVDAVTVNVTVDEVMVRGSVDGMMMSVLIDEMMENVSIEEMMERNRLTSGDGWDSPSTSYTQCPSFPIPLRIDTDRDLRSYGRKVTFRG